MRVVCAFLKKSTNGCFLCTLLYCYCHRKNWY
jgi:hypothetical protein